MHNNAKDLSETEREQLFFLLLKKLEQDLEVKLKVNIVLDKDNKIIPTIYAIAEKN